MQKSLVSTLVPTSVPLCIQNCFRKSKFVPLCFQIWSHFDRTLFFFVPAQAPSSPLWRECTSAPDARLFLKKRQNRVAKFEKSQTSGARVRSRLKGDEGACPSPDSILVPFLTKFGPNLIHLVSLFTHF